MSEWLTNQDYFSRPDYPPCYMMKVSIGSNTGRLSPGGVKALSHLLLGGSNAKVLGVGRENEASGGHDGGEHGAELLNGNVHASWGNLVLDGGNNVFLNSGNDLEDGGHNGLDDCACDLADCSQDILEDTKEIECLLDWEGLSFDSSECDNGTQGNDGEFHYF